MTTVSEGTAEYGDLGSANNLIVVRVVGPNGAKECSHGWSGARYSGAKRNPWEEDHVPGNCPGGAEEGIRQFNGNCRICRM
jgi:hypothetical protein